MHGRGRDWNILLLLLDQMMLAEIAFDNGGVFRQRSIYLGGETYILAEGQ
jgi:hypothetical protein